MKNREREGGKRGGVRIEENRGWRVSSLLDKASIEEELSTINYITCV